MAPETLSRSSDPAERRIHRRMSIRLPVECRREGDGRSLVVRTITQNVSTGGLYLELDSPDFALGDNLRVDLTVPAAEGVSPYQGRATCNAQVVRLDPPERTTEEKRRRFGVAARFLDRLRISY
ncbi:MAG TPA: PilZ domain-containing protein [Phycisphaerae bacterium]|nr:PilZ domain-containing protein [Phycisphaerae bacterium]